MLGHWIVLCVEGKIKFGLILFFVLLQFLLKATVNFVILILIFTILLQAILGRSVLLILTKYVLSSSFRDLDMINIRHHILKLWTK